MKYHWNPWTEHNWCAPDAEVNDASLPFITLGVLNYNRCDDLRRTLDVLAHAVQYPRYEIVVIDNGSTDGSIEMVRSEFPEAILHEVGENLGIFSREYQTRLARGKYLFSFDNDSFPGTPAMVLRIVQHMESHSDVDALSSTCYQPLSGLTETQGWEPFRVREDKERGFEGPYIVEGGVCFRVATLKKVKGYERAFVYGKEGMDLGIQLHKIGAGIYLCPWFGTLHFASPVIRSPGFKVYANSRNAIWAIAMHWPMMAAVPLWIGLVARRILAMVMHRDTIRDNARGILDGFRGMRPFLRCKPKLTLKQVYSLKRWYFALYRWA